MVCVPIHVVFDSVGISEAWYREDTMQSSKSQSEHLENAPDVKQVVSDIRHRHSQP